MESRFQFKNIFSLARNQRFLAAVDKHEILLLAAAIAYTTALALAPFLIILLSILTLLGEQWQQSVIQQMTVLVGAQGGEALQAIIVSAKGHTTFRGFSGVVSFLILAVSASTIFNQLRLAFDKINEYAPTRKKASGLWFFMREKLLSIGLVFGFIFMLIISLVVTTAIAAVFSGREGFFWEAVAMVVSFLVFTGLFAAMFRFVPSSQEPGRKCFQSAVVATVFFLLGKMLITLYLAKSAVGSAYGAAGSLVVLLVWLYYTAVTLLLSDEYTNNVLLVQRRSE